MIRLLNTHTGEFVSFDDPRTTRYAVLSHVWSKEGDADYVKEQNYQDVHRIQKKHKGNILEHLSPKLRSLCRVAREADLPFAWADFSCPGYGNGGFESRLIVELNCILLHRIYRLR